jgi:integrase
MEAGQKKPDSVWKKIGPCLYRYAPSGIYYGLIKSSGKQIRQSLETDDLPLARRKLQDMRRDIELTDPELARRTLESQSERFLPTVTGTPSTVYNVSYAIKRLLADWPRTSPRLLSKIRKGDCEQWLATFGHLAPSTVNTYISCATKFFHLAVSDSAIARSPMEGITYRRRGKLTRLTPTPEQFEAIIKDLKAQAFNGHGSAETSDYIALSGLLGLGQAELAGIQRQHIDSEAETIKVFRRKTQQTFLIPIYPQAREIVERRLKTLHSDPEARLLTFDDCRSALAGACRRLKIPHFEVRALRRYFITQALRRGVDVPTVALWQGHRDGGALLLKTYADEVRLDHSLKMSRLMTNVLPVNIIPIQATS